MVNAPLSSGAPASQGMEDASPWALEYVREETTFEPTDPGRVRLTLLTDPWSVWCWGFEPVRRTLALRYPSIEFRSLVGGMFEQLPSMRERGFDISQFFTMVQRTTGMPISTHAVEKDRPDSTYPACIHVHAVRLLRPALEEDYLRALREAVYLEGRNVSRRDVARDVAEGVGIDADEFDEAMDSGEPEREFRQRLDWLHQQDLHAYPTLIITVGRDERRVEGFQNIAGVLQIVQALSGQLHAAQPPPDLKAVVPEGQRVATREVAEVLGVSIEQAVDELTGAVDDGWLVRERHETGDVWSTSTP